MYKHNSTAPELNTNQQHVRKLHSISSYTCRMGSYMYMYITIPILKAGHPSVLLFTVLIMCIMCIVCMGYLSFLPTSALASVLCCAMHMYFHGIEKL